jgi:hypothetical protein
MHYFVQIKSHTVCCSFLVFERILQVFFNNIMNQTKAYQLEKALWTDADFELMSWHDCPIHALSFDRNNNLLFDIDYIFKWVLMKNKRNYKFWIAPCTLVFENVYGIEFESDHTSIIIDNITRENPQVPKNAEYLQRDFEYDWIIETTVGEVLFKSVGFKQYVRRTPMLINAQDLDMGARVGISFSLDNIMI